jgi:hypothetical protein
MEGFFHGMKLERTNYFTKYIKEKNETSYNQTINTSFILYDHIGIANRFFGIMHVE